jgi:hypothetical protein
MPTPDISITRSVVEHVIKRLQACADSDNPDVSKILLRNAITYLRDHPALASPPVQKAATAPAVAQEAQHALGLLYSLRESVTRLVALADLPADARVSLYVPEEPEAPAVSATWKDEDGRLCFSMSGPTTDEQVALVQRVGEAIGLAGYFDALCGWWREDSNRPAEWPILQAVLCAYEMGRKDADRSAK